MYQPNWESDFFRGVALEMWRRAISPQQTTAEVDFLERTLKPPSGGTLLDVPCGNGRHARELASRGYRLTGVDLSDEYIGEASAAADGRWICGSMLDLPWTSEFDGAYCFGNSFGYLDREKAAAFLKAVSRTLKPGARFVIDTGMAAESILPTRVKSRWFQLGDIYMLSENQYDPMAGRLDIQYTFIQNGKIETKPSSSFTFTVAEIGRMLSSAGLQPVEALSSVTGEPYDLGSPRLILVSAKT